MLGRQSLLREAAAGAILLAVGSLSADELPLYRDPSKTTATARATDVSDPELRAFERSFQKPKSKSLAGCGSPSKHPER